MSEKQLEARCRVEAQRRGGMLLKWQSQQMAGVPDRLLFYQGHTVPIEFKNGAKGRLTKLQKVMLMQIEKTGTQCAVVRTYDAFIALLALIESAVKDDRRADIHVASGFREWY